MREREGGIRANLDAAGGGGLSSFSFGEAHFRTPPFLIIIAQSLTDILARIYESFYSLYTFMFLFVMAGPYQLCSNFFAIVYN